MRVSWRSELPMWLLIGAQFLLAAGSWPDSPDSVPTRWALDGNVDGYGDRFQGLLLLPLVSLGLYLALLFAPQVGPRRENYPHFAGSYTLLRFAVTSMACWRRMNAPLVSCNRPPLFPTAFPTASR